MSRIAALPPPRDNHPFERFPTIPAIGMLGFMDTPTPSQPDALFDRDVNAIATAWLQDQSLACMAIPAKLATEAAAVLRATGVHQIAAGRLADTLEESILGDKCLLNVAQCQAAVLLFGEIAETALPQAPKAERLAAIFRDKLITES